eukprot:CAMPEP_0194273778 /NCGR_PEP_ID=MMETSP0169-20130528/7045_1 /TAXON_ID=218684 /ORGANISM="Corethron pennatum, Strain L29A3" /LENGTH=89 /DNA_ID=CAMNT_0039016827 /DNA_START=208 /DNA_END=474 /DNA_ORIENTATION=-
MAQDNRCWDGNWIAEGLHRMYMGLDEENFCDNELEDFLEDLEEDGGLRMEREFLYLSDAQGDDLVQQMIVMNQEILQPRGLALASGVVR